MNTSKAKHGEIHRGATMACCPLVSSVEKASKTTCGAPHYSYSCYTADTGSPCSSFLLLDISLYMTNVLVSEWAETNQVLCLLSQNIGKLVTHSFLFPGQRNSFWIGSFLLALSHAGLRNEMGQTKRSYSSSTFCLIILRVFFLMCNNLRYAENICRYAF